LISIYYAVTATVGLYYGVDSSTYVRCASLRRHRPSDLRLSKSEASRRTARRLRQ
jgi:hypothetical protein